MDLKYEMFTEPNAACPHWIVLKNNWSATNKPYGDYILAQFQYESDAVDYMTNLLTGGTK